MQPQQLGPYKIGKRLGRGGMGAVYEGLDTVSGRPAAVKVLFPHLAMEEGFRDRFEVEIETLKKLDHPNIVKLYGWGEEDGQLYYAMELVPGTTLDHELQSNRRCSWQDVTRWGIDLAKALKHAHDRGVIHRDIKPANLLLTTDGLVKLSDFGIARLFGNTRLTADGSLIGTAEYMSPEQAEGKPVTFHCDLYSLGCALYALLAGRPPFQTSSLPEMLNMHRSATPPSLRRFCSDVPDELEAILLRLLDKTPQKRAPNAGVLARQLASMEHGLSMISRSVVAKREPVAGDTRRDGGSHVFDVDPPNPLGATMDLPTGAGYSAVPGGTSAFSIAGDSTSASAVSPAAKRFTTVEEERQKEAERAQSDRAPVLVPLILLATFLVTVALLLWWLLKPISADELFQRIEAVASAEDPGRLGESAPDIEKFLARFSDDPRAGVVRQYQEQIDLLRAEKRLQLRVGRPGQEDSLTPIQRDYFDAMRQAELDPQQGRAQLQALIALYGDEADDDATRQCLELARRHLARLEKQIEQSLPDRLALIDAKLKQAEALRDSDPAAARALCENLITLYSEKTWADESVKKARDLLAALPE